MIGTNQTKVVALLRTMRPECQFTESQVHYVIDPNDFIKWVQDSGPDQFVEAELGTTSNYEFTTGIKPIWLDLTIIGASHCHVAPDHDEFIVTLGYADVGIVWMRHVSTTVDFVELGNDRMSQAQLHTMSRLTMVLALLPSYIHDARYEVRRARTSFSEVKERLGLTKTPKEQQVKYRVIRAVKPIYLPSGKRRTPKPPQHKVLVPGFWRAAKYGHDQDGNPVQGKTWVRGHSRWNDKPDGPTVVWIKEGLK